MAFGASDNSRLKKKERKIVNYPFIRAVNMWYLINTSFSTHSAIRAKTSATGSVHNHHIRTTFNWALICHCSRDNKAAPYASARHDEKTMTLTSRRKDTFGSGPGVVKKERMESERAAERVGKKERS